MKVSYEKPAVEPSSDWKHADTDTFYTCPESDGNLETVQGRAELGKPWITL